jgi:hypothetical protein
MYWHPVYSGVKHAQNLVQFFTNPHRIPHQNSSKRAAEKRETIVIINLHRARDSHQLHPKQLGNKQNP